MPYLTAQQKLRAFLTRDLHVHLEQLGGRRLLDLFVVCRRLQPGDVQTALVCHRALGREARRNLMAYGYLNVEWADWQRLVHNVLEAEGYEFTDGRWGQGGVLARGVEHGPSARSTPKPGAGSRRAGRAVGDGWSTLITNQENRTMQASAIGLEWADREVSGWDERAEQPVVQEALKATHAAAAPLLGEGADLEHHAMYAVARTLQGGDVGFAAEVYVRVSRWYFERRAQGWDDLELRALRRALARFLEAQQVRSSEVLFQHGRGAGERTAPQSAD